MFTTLYENKGGKIRELGKFRQSKILLVWTHGHFMYVYTYNEITMKMTMTMTMTMKNKALIADHIRYHLQLYDHQKYLT